MEILAVRVDDVDLGVVVAVRQREGDAARGHARVTRRPKHGLVRGPMHRHAEVVVRRVGDSEAATLDRATVDDVVQLQNQDVAFPSAFDLTGDQPNRPETVP